MVRGNELWWISPSMKLSSGTRAKPLSANSIGSTQGRIGASGSGLAASGLMVCLSTACRLAMYSSDETGETGPGTETTDGSASAEESTKSGDATIDGTSGSGSGDVSICGDGACDDGEICAADCGPTSVCGDGIAAGDEACDDGNGAGGDGCEADCSVTPGWACGDGECAGVEDGASCYADCGVCGDGVEEGPEECDEAEMNADDGTCRPECVRGVCGDGVLAQSEACDDGNVVGGDGCAGDCTCVCGDGVVCGAEACDDGPMNAEGAGCKPGCALNVCGDGSVWEGVEECDDADDNDVDECSADCDIPRYVFKTSVKYLGDLGGIAGADAECNALAASGTVLLHQRTFRAWLTGVEPDTAPAVRIQDHEFHGWYKLVTGARVARGWGDLTDGSIQQAIIVDERGDEEASSSVWTNTAVDGTPTGDIHCSDWSTTAGKGAVGTAKADVLDAEWTGFALSQCGSAKALYCFEVLD